MAEFAWDPESYLALMAEEVPDYPQLQDELVAAVRGLAATTVLDLGLGSGLTAQRVADALPGAHLVGVDDSAAMLAAAAESLQSDGATLRQGRLEDPLPDGPFDLVVAMLAVHHLDGPGKADLFSRVAAVLHAGGHFVLADLVVPTDPSDVVAPIDGTTDTPSSLADQLVWLRAAGLDPAVRWAYRDLAVVTAHRPF